MSTDKTRIKPDLRPVLHACIKKGGGEVTPGELEYFEAGHKEGVRVAGVESDRLQQILAAAYQLASAVGAPQRLLDVLANPSDATQEQINALLPLELPRPPAAGWQLTPFAIVKGRYVDGRTELAVSDGTNYTFTDGDCFDRDGDTLDGFTAEFLTQHQLEQRLVSATACPACAAAASAPELSPAQRAAIIFKHTGIDARSEPDIFREIDAAVRAAIDADRQMPAHGGAQTGQNRAQTRLDAGPGVVPESIGATPADWQLVPTRPTPAMVAAAQFHTEHDDETARGDPQNYRARGQAMAVYSDMLAAAPPAPTPTPTPCALPAGWKPVPIDPDIGMLRAALEHSRNNGGYLPHTSQLAVVDQVYRAMIAAAPAPAPTTKKEGNQ